MDWEKKHNKTVKQEYKKYEEQRKLTNKTIKKEEIEINTTQGSFSKLLEK